MSNATLCGVIDDMHEADLKRGGIGYLDPVQNRVATQHGFRSTFRDWAAEVAYFPKDVIEHALAHKLKDEAEAAYQRGTLLVKRATLMEQWGGVLQRPEPNATFIGKCSGPGCGKKHIIRFDCGFRSWVGRFAIETQVQSLSPKFPASTEGYCATWRATRVAARMQYDPVWLIWQ